MIERSGNASDAARIDRTGITEIGNLASDQIRHCRESKPGCFMHKNSSSAKLSQLMRRKLRGPQLLVLRCNDWRSAAVIVKSFEKSAGNELAGQKFLLAWGAEETHPTLRKFPWEMKT